MSETNRDADVINDLAELQELNEAIDQLTGDCRETCPEADACLALAWWFTEEAIRERGVACSSPEHKTDGYCGCCAHFKNLAPQAQALRSRL